MDCEFTKLMGMADVISFDIFDTLLLRPYLNQEDLWLDFGCREFGEKGAEFLKARIAADRKTYAAATQRGGEHTLDEVYALMPQPYAGLRKKEGPSQRECLVANPEMLEVWKLAGRLGKRRVIVSDMYLPRQVLEESLRRNGFEGWDAIYVSSDRQKRKSTGGLYKIVREDFGEMKILHVGDNELSDVCRARESGLNSFHYVNIREAFFTECPFANVFLHEYPSQAKRKLVGALVLGWHLYKCENAKWTYWNRLGYLFGGVLGHMYVKWMVETARQMGVNRLVFVARDGYVWQKICNALYPEIKTEYVYAPRLTSIRALGAIGNDPGAICDRQRYMGKHLAGNDSAAELEKYRRYISQYNFDEHAALVDGCSSGFSAQRLVEAALGRPVTAFYLIAMAEVKNGDSLYNTNLYFLPFQMFAEFLFGSPEAPIEDVSLNGVAHKQKIPDPERLKMNVAEEIAEGAVACARDLSAHGVGLDRQGWLDYFAAFSRNLTDEDRRHLDAAKNAPDVEQVRFLPVVAPVGFRKVYRHGIFLGTWKGRHYLDMYTESFYLLGKIKVLTRNRKYL